jgi:hypothetical protein
MRVKHERFPKLYDSLTDEEILAAISLCNKILDRKDDKFKDEFENLCFFLFEGDVLLAEDNLKSVIKLYTEAYMKRRLN